MLDGIKKINLFWHAIQKLIFVYEINYVIRMSLKTTKTLILFLSG